MDTSKYTYYGMVSGFFYKVVNIDFESGYITFDLNELFVRFEKDIHIEPFKKSYLYKIEN